MEVLWASWPVSVDKAINSKSTKRVLSKAKVESVCGRHPVLTMHRRAHTRIKYHIIISVSTLGSPVPATGLLLLRLASPLVS